MSTDVKGTSAHVIASYIWLTFDLSMVLAHIMVFMIYDFFFFYRYLQLLLLKLLVERMRHLLWVNLGWLK